ncbi:YqfO family protein [Alloalcanivorax xenomutans]|uniref:YqfO family protein n=1 Tax=Alloalcanivorax xenomutans TaxID=1094342 RepID=A0A9Q3W1X3_9GAMM|nr:YqfO family protein [Alloalcanivorax xenomutans]ARB45121.1 NGG1p interacting factor NIF3 [Alloalcanivorax xenomutans]KYZ87267.1 NGG1p interacting factor NIF3 [Alcanivorax sp. KX64203]MCE7509135.1 YqfO family protein [Alloalcanivorax xenomutans]MCE7522450.1 YqfO family protein [Alloalcanivorax xenomutans]
MTTLYKLCFYVPVSHVETVKAAVFDAGAGRIGDYDRCSFQVLGQGQFRPLDGSNPYLGSRGLVETVEEYRVEMICEADRLEPAVRALRDAHPYEEPAIDLWPLAPLPV